MLTLLFTVLLALSTPCAAEDSTNCTWNANTSGNNVGTSFVDVNGTAYYFGK